MLVFISQGDTSCIMSVSTDYGRPVRKSPSLHGRKSTSHSKIFRYGRSIFCLTHQPNFFRYLWFMPSLGVRSPWAHTSYDYWIFIQRVIVLILLLCTSFEKLSSHPALRQDLNHFIYALRPQIILILFMGNHWSKTPLRSTAVSLSKSPCILFSVLSTVYIRTVSS